MKLKGFGSQADGLDALSRESTCMKRVAMLTQNLEHILPNLAMIDLSRHTGDEDRTKVLHLKGRTRSLSKGYELSASLKAIGSHKPSPDFSKTGRSCVAVVGARSCNNSAETESGPAALPRLRPKMMASTSCSEGRAAMSKTGSGAVDAPSCHGDQQLLQLLHVCRIAWSLGTDGFAPTDGRLTPRDGNDQ